MNWVKIESCTKKYQWSNWYFCSPFTVAQLWINQFESIWRIDALKKSLFQLIIFYVTYCFREVFVSWKKYFWNFLIDVYVEFQKSISHYYENYVPNIFSYLVIITTFVTSMYNYKYILYIINLTSVKNIIVMKYVIITTYIFYVCWHKKILFYVLTVYHLLIQKIFFVILNITW